MRRIREEARFVEPAGNLDRGRMVQPTEAQLRLDVVVDGIDVRPLARWTHRLWPAVRRS